MKELEEEGVATRKVLERVPDDKIDWSPHEKSMSIGKLVGHLADIAVPAIYGVSADEQDM